MNVLELIFRRVGELGSRHIFGIPGREAIGFGGLARGGIEYVVCRHEQGAGFMANGYGRVSGRPGVCHTTFGPGVTNLVTSLADAYLDQVPVVAICAQVESDRRHWGTHQFVDTGALLGPVAKEVHELESPTDVQRTVDNLYNLAKADPPGPVVLSLPLDILCAATSGTVRSTDSVGTKDPGTVLRADWNEGIRVFLEASRPVVLCGAGIARAPLAAEMVRELVELRGAACLTTYAAKGVLDEASPLAVGPIGRYLWPSARSYLEECDFLLILGYEEQEGGLELAISLVPEMTRHLRVGGTNWEGRSPRSARGSDTLTVLEQLLIALRARQPGNLVGVDPSGEGVDRTTCAGAVSRLMATLSHDKIPLISDVGMHKHLVAMHFVADHPSHVLFSSGLGCAGSALPVGIGASLALGGAPVHVVTGDGGFLMNIQELETLHRLSLPLTIVVLVDRAFGLIKHFERGAWGGAFGVDFQNPDFSLLGPAFGLETKVCSSFEECCESLGQSQAHHPRLLTVPIDYSWEMLPYDNS